MFTREYLNGTSTNDQMVNVLLQNIAMIQEAPLPLNESNPDYRSMMLRVPNVIHGFQNVAEVYQQALTNQLTMLTSVSIGLFVVCLVGFILIYVLVFRRLLAHLQDEHEKAKRMLLQVPLDCVKTNYPVQYLLRGKSAAQEFYLRDIPGIRVTSDGIPVPVDSVMDLSYVRRTLASSDNLVTGLYRKWTTWLTGKPMKRTASNSSGESHSAKLTTKKSETHKETAQVAVVRSVAAINETSEDGSVSDHGQRRITFMDEPSGETETQL